MLATTGQPEHDQGAWAWECKWDGWRALVYARRGHSGPHPHRPPGQRLPPELTGLVDALDGHRVVLDGELVACRDGNLDFYALGPRMMHTGRTARWAAGEFPSPSWPSTSSTSTARI